MWWISGISCGLMVSLVGLVVSMVFCSVIGELVVFVVVGVGLLVYLV